MWSQLPDSMKIDIVSAAAKDCAAGNRSARARKYGFTNKRSAISGSL